MKLHFVDAKNILTASLSDDMRGSGMNIYRGCSHGCIYCDSRSRCYGFTHDFEDIEVKQNAPALLENALRSRRKRCMIGTGSMSDPYMHCERTLMLTRRCLEVIYRYGFGVAILTKSALILRDIDLMTDINERARCVAQMTLTTCDEALCAVLEPRVSTTHERYEALKEFQRRKIPTVVWLCPILPYINDTEENIRGLVDYCADAGVHGIIHFGMGMTLRDGDREYYYAALDRHFPGLKQRYVREYGNAYQLRSPAHARLERLFVERCEKYGIVTDVDALFSYVAELPDKYEQTKLW